MKKRYMIFAAFVFAVLFAGCSGTISNNDDPHPNQTHKENPAFATPENSVVSPSSKFILTIHGDYSDYYNQIIVYENGDSSHPVFTADRNYRTRDRLYFCWDTDGNIWVYSGDAGTTLWRLDSESEVWIEEYPRDATMPAILESAI